MAGKGYRAHAYPFFASLNILKFEDLFVYNCSIFMLNYTVEKVPDSFVDFFTPLRLPNRTCGYQTDRLKSNFLAQFPTYFLPKIWNNNSFKLKLETSWTKFKTNLYHTLISNYSTFVRCNDQTFPDYHS